MKSRSRMRIDGPCGQTGAEAQKHFAPVGRLKPPASTVVPAFSVVPALFRKLYSRCDTWPLIPVTDAPGVFPSSVKPFTFGLIQKRLALYEQSRRLLPHPCSDGDRSGVVSGSGCGCKQRWDSGSPFRKAIPISSRAFLGLLRTSFKCPLSAFASRHESCRLWQLPIFRD